MYDAYRHDVFDDSEYFGATSSQYTARRRGAAVIDYQIASEATGFDEKMLMTSQFHPRPRWNKSRTARLALPTVFRLAVLSLSVIRGRSASRVETSSDLSRCYAFGLKKDDSQVIRGACISTASDEALLALC